MRAALTSLKKGQSVKLAFDGRSYKLAADAPPPAPAVPAPQPGREWSDEEKRAIASQIQMYAKLMRYCIEQAREQCGELVREEEVFAIAKFLFELAVQKRT